VSKPCIAIIFDDTVRPDTTGIYCRRALEELSHVTHALPNQTEHLTLRTGDYSYSFFLNIDDWFQYRLPRSLRPSAWWAIDTHMDIDWYVAKAPDFDMVFTAQRNAVGRLIDRGAKKVVWLPLACDPEVHRHHEVAIEHDICFVGNVYPGPRQDMLAFVQNRYRNVFVGRRFFADMARTYSASRIVLNRSIRDDLNMRVFEALACKSFLLTNELPEESGQGELFGDGVHLATYRDLDELRDKLDFYLKREDLRERIARIGQTEVLKNHTYRHRMQRIIQEMEALRSRKKSDLSTAKIREDRTSVVILTHNQLDFTRRCLDSIRACTQEPHELIIVDNASSDGTVEYLRQQENILLIENPTNRGFPAGCNQGIKASTGERILLLNNDVVVTRGWLRRMVRTLETCTDIGLVGPCTNMISGPQCIPVDYGDVSDLEKFAEGVADCYDGCIEETDRLVGFCLLFRRGLVSEIGFLDERFGLGNFEDDDFCHRARLAGYRCVIARDTFVHHFGSVTFRALGPTTHEQSFYRSAKLFHEKWTDSNEQAGAATQQACLEELAEPEHLISDISREETGQCQDPCVERIQLSLCMIVRNSAMTLEVCLESVKPWVDEMVIVDTGSTDGTVEIAQRTGAFVYHYPWSESFASARNESLRHARGSWIFWMDSDDTISPENGQRLRTLSHRLVEDGTLGFVMQVHCPNNPDSPEDGMTVVDHVKMFRNLPGLRFEGRVHEQILPAIRRIGGNVEWTDIFLVHSGADHSNAGRIRKRERDLRLLQLELEDRPDHPFALFNLGMTLADMGKHEQAITAFEQSLAVSDPNESHVRKLYALMVSSFESLGQHVEAAAICLKGRQLFPDDPELLFREGVISQHSGRLLDAERAFLAVLKCADTPNRYFSSFDHGILTYKARHNLALVYTAMGQDLDAEFQWWAAVESEPRFRQGWRALGDNLIRQGRLDAAEALCRQLDRDAELELEAILLRGKIAAIRGEIAKARCFLMEAEERAPSDSDALRVLCQLFFEHGSLSDAHGALRRLTEREPLDASAHHNLGTVLLRMNRYSEAVTCYRESLRLRPDHAETHLRLGCALKELGELIAAKRSFHAALELAPSNDRVHKVLAEIRTSRPTYTVRRSVGSGLLLERIATADVTS
jgi:GT2 family glycosyltransferase/tetratricopeptide (TPR) repeat protein